MRDIPLLHSVNTAADAGFKQEELRAAAFLLHDKIDGMPCTSNLRYNDSYYYDVLVVMTTYYRKTLLDECFLPPVSICLHVN